jgi:hypothetical protein
MAFAKSDKGQATRQGGTRLSMVFIVDAHGLSALHELTAAAAMHTMFF